MTVNPCRTYFPSDKDFLSHVRGEGSAVEAEVIDLGVKGLLVVSGGGQAANLSATFDAQAIAHFRTGMLKPTKLARDLYRLMRLDTLPSEEIDDLFNELTGRRAGE